MEFDENMTLNYSDHSVVVKVRKFQKQIHFLQKSNDGFLDFYPKGLKWVKSKI